MRRLRARDATDSPAPRTQRRKWKAQAPLGAVGRIDAFELAQERGPLHQAVWSTCAALVVVPYDLLPPGQAVRSAARPAHELREELGEGVEAVQREHVRDVLVRTDD